MTTTAGGERQRVVHAIVVAAWIVAGLAAVLLGTGVAAAGVLGDATGRVPVRVTTPATFGGVQPCAPAEHPLDEGTCRPPDGWQEDLLMVPMPADGLTISASEGPWVTRLLTHAPAWLGLVAGGGAALLLVPVIRSTAAGRPFAPGNARRLALATGVVGGAWAGATVAWFAAAHLVVSRLEQQGLPTGLGEGWLAADLRTRWWPLLVVAMLGTLAAATGRGSVLAAETEGLV